MKVKKLFAAIFSVLILLCFVGGVVYLRKTYARIEGRICKTNVKEISPDLRFTKIKEINKCTDIEEMFLSRAYENEISNFADFKKLTVLSLSYSKVNSSDSKKMGTFNNLRELDFLGTTIDLEGFNTRTLSDLCIFRSEIKHFNSLVECLSLRNIIIADSVIDDSVIYSDGRYVMKNSRFLSSFDNTTNLTIKVDSIEDVSGICEMDSLQELTVNSDSISDNEKKLLDDKGVIVILE